MITRLSCVWFSFVLASVCDNSVGEVPIEAMRERLSSLLEQRKGIETLWVRGTASGDGETMESFQVFISGSKFRTDKEFLLEGKSGDQRTRIDRFAIVGDEMRIWQSLYGARLAPLEPSINRQFNMQYFGMLPVALVYLRPDLSVDQTLVAQAIDHWDNPEVRRETKSGVECFVATVYRSPGEKISVYFDNSIILRGFQLEGESFRDSVWIDRYTSAGDMLFPAQVHCLWMSNGNVRLNETAIIHEVRINENLTDSSFEFSELGVQNGDKVRVENGSLGPEPMVLGVYSNGRILAAGTPADTKAFANSSPFVSIALGAVFIIFAALLIWNCGVWKQT